MAVALPPEFGHLPLSLTSGRYIKRMLKWEDGTRPDHLLVHQFSGLETAGWQWLQENATLAHEVMTYRLYTPNPGSDPISELSARRLNGDTYRYSLPRDQSLTSW